MADEREDIKTRHWSTACCIAGPVCIAVGLATEFGWIGFVDHLSSLFLLAAILLGLGLHLRRLPD